MSIYLKCITMNCSIVLGTKRTIHFNRNNGLVFVQFFFSSRSWKTLVFIESVIFVDLCSYLNNKLVILNVFKNSPKNTYNILFYE